jgi:seryl-tRNA(Sec) selenium transferase
MPSIFEKYNLKQVINTSGRMTALGVSTPRPEVVQAAMDGMNQYFEMKDLVNKTGEYIASNNSKVVMMPLDASSLMGSIGGIAELIKESGNERKS